MILPKCMESRKIDIMLAKFSSYDKVWHLQRRVNKDLEDMVHFMIMSNIGYEYTRLWFC